VRVALSGSGLKWEWPEVRVVFKWEWSEVGVGRTVRDSLAVGDHVEFQIAVDSRDGSKHAVGAPRALSPVCVSAN
jgi:hypothetical protein